MAKRKHTWAVFEDTNGIYVHMGLFDYPVRIIFHPDLERIEKYIAWKFDDPEPQNSRAMASPKGRTYLKSGYTPIIWMKKPPETADEWATLAHEASHAVVSMFEWAGMNLNRETDEVFAHAVGRIVRSIGE